MMLNETQYKNLNLLKTVQAWSEYTQSRLFNF